ncbi:hypothetical protein DS742_21910 [Lacrimispora amygdalina]|uniref:Carboxypeptidase regulatory-like domain-containing protein n=1 Tax=Lacrimispora amygdalina TaxID=253257 RepID=A0A3E2N6X9_9FIRM|nr:hypothetical protein [Clostridium indicum]RFZ76753.1 hypothetical protein DS742_21910 [Clostridium indicum]
MAHAIIKGMVSYRNCGPVGGAVIILERIDSVFNEELNEEHLKNVYLDYTQSNRCGEFCFPVSDTTATYRIRVFDNHHEGGRS